MDALLARFRQFLAAFLVGLLMLASAAPCTAAAAPSPRPVIAAPADPCQARHGAPAQACAQFACQQAVNLSPGFDAPAIFASPAAFAPASLTAFGRSDAPPLPPPRTLL